MIHTIFAAKFELVYPTRRCRDTEVVSKRRLMHFIPNRLYRSLTRPVDAVPLDLFRILVGLIALAYFFRTFLEAADFSAPGGLIDHDFSQRVFWFTRMGFFNGGMSLAAFQII